MPTPDPLYRFPYPTPLIQGVLLGRYKRFSADVRLGDGTVVTAHCVNTGRMEGLTLPGRTVYISPADNPKRKLRYTWEIVEVDGVLVGANTSIPNTLVGALLRDRIL
ncbi:MAG: DNA/RNA nuclease SfsA, partial [Candidatus Sumerlaeia bacterium]|nr:DNA/RNA nuclease SfsA [Candidatus Sumerlaeia bacterium]